MRDIITVVSINKIDRPHHLGFDYSFGNRLAILIHTTRSVSSNGKAVISNGDVIGDPLFTSALRACKPEARVLTIGFAAGEVPQIAANHILVKNIDVMGFYWGGYLKFKPEVLTHSLRALFTMYENGELAPHISHRFTLEEASEALDVLRRRLSTGKVVVTV